LDVGAGVVDPDYRGNVGVVLFNLSDTDYKVKKGDRIAQLVLEKFLSADVEEVNELDDTDRSAGGFGSTGQ
jgi:dUTP pyrophosphatase